jgi:Tol biopolymer transport system component
VLQDCFDAYPPHRMRAPVPKGDNVRTPRRLLEMLPPVLSITGIVSAVVVGVAPTAEATVPGVNGRIAFVADDTIGASVGTVGPDGTDRGGLSAGCPGSSFDAAFSPDGRRFAYTCYEAGDEEIYVADANGRHNAPITNNSVHDYSPTWSRDGSQIAFVRGDGPNNIFVMPSSGGQASNLTRNPSYYDGLDWSPVADEILFINEGTFTMQTISSIPSATPTPHQISSVTSVSSPTWSPDGTQIAFAKFLGPLTGEVYKISLDDPDTEIHLSDETDGLIDSSPVWSPDGTKIAFAHSAQDGLSTEDIYVMDAADGANRVPILQERFGESPTSWAPQTLTPCTIEGTSAYETLIGTPGDDVICGYQGSDRIEGLGGDDILRGGRGEDVLLGGDGADVIQGDEGIDRVSFAGDAAVDVDLRVGTAAGQGADTLFRVEWIIGSSASDVLRGDGHENWIRGLGGDDTLFGFAADDRLLGGRGDDTMDAGPGHDLCYQGAGTGTATSCYSV